MDYDTKIIWETVFGKVFFPRFMELSRYLYINLDLHVNLPWNLVEFNTEVISYSKKPNPPFGYV